MIETVPHQIQKRRCSMAGEQGSELIPRGVRWLDHGGAASVTSRTTAVYSVWVVLRLLHSVTNRRIVRSRAELMAAVKLLRDTLRENGARLHAGYLSEREVHLALQAGEGPLSAITGSFQHECARLLNRTHHEHGSLFRPHYHVLLFQHQRWLVPLARFIHWIRRLEAREDCQGGLWWSSDAVYRGSRKQHWVTTNVVLRMLTRGAYNRDVQGEAYRNCATGRRHPATPAYSGMAQRKIRGFWVMPSSSRKRGGPRGRRSPHRGRRARHLEEDISGVVMQVIEQFVALCDKRLPPRQAAAWDGILTYENVRSRSRKRPLPMVRALSVSYLIGHEIATPAQAARFFGCGPRPVSAHRRRFYEALFRKCFSAKSEILFSPHRGGRNVGSRSKDDDSES